MTAMRLQLVPKPGRPDFLDLPWDQPLDDWQSSGSRSSRAASAGTSCASSSTTARFYALKELPHEVAHREYKLLRALTREGLPAVEAVGIVHPPSSKTCC